MAARDDILRALRRAQGPEVELPSLPRGAAPGPDPLPRFAEAVARVAGLCSRASSFEEARAIVQSHAPFRSAKRVVSLVPELALTTEAPLLPGDPHDLDGTDLAVLRGDLGVAENGAVWVDGQSLPHRALLVVPEHLVLVVAATSIVSDLHEAYRLLDLARRPRFGVFVSGPSKTADIEQALVIGAHGARSLLVVTVA